jgi:hypothetical protein
MARGGLGIILTPYGKVPGSYPSEISRTTHGGVPLCPFDPQYNQRGEVGLFYDTPLGRAVSRVPMGRTLADIPNDFELAKVRGLLTPNQGWVATNNGPYNEFYVPPNGWTATQPTNTRITLPTLGATSDDVVAELNRHHRNMFALGVLSTAAVLVSSVIAAIRTARLMRAEKAG